MTTSGIRHRPGLHHRDRSVLARRWRVLTLGSTSIAAVVALCMVGFVLHGLHQQSHDRSGVATLEAIYSLLVLVPNLLVGMLFLLATAPRWCRRPHGAAMAAVAGLVGVCMVVGVLWNLDDPFGSFGGWFEVALLVLCGLWYLGTVVFCLGAVDQTAVRHDA